MTGEDLARLRAVFAAYPEVAGVWLFGSQALGTATARSDVGDRSVAIQSSMARLAGWQVTAAVPVDARW
jgi:predicted nucleotidyltransferase